MVAKLNQLLTDREVSDILAMKDLITKWIKGVYDFAYEKHYRVKSNGQGYKLVEGTSRRTITDPDAAAKTLLDNGYKEETSLSHVSSKVSQTYKSTR